MRYERDTATPNMHKLRVIMPQTVSLQKCVYCYGNGDSGPIILLLGLEKKEEACCTTRATDGFGLVLEGSQTRFGLHIHFPVSLCALQCTGHYINFRGFASGMSALIADRYSSNSYRRRGSRYVRTTYEKTVQRSASANLNMRPAGIFQKSVHCRVRQSTAPPPSDRCSV